MEKIKLRCARCGDRKVLDDFAGRSNRPKRHDRQSYCRKCNREYRIEREDRADKENSGKGSVKSRVRSLDYKILNLHGARVIYENKGSIICIVSDFKVVGQFSGDMKP